MADDRPDRAGTDPDAGRQGRCRDHGAGSDRSLARLAFIRRLFLNRVQFETRSASLPKPPGGRRSESLKINRKGCGPNDNILFSVSHGAHILR
jgi:hypothetical protein